MVREYKQVEVGGYVNKEQIRCWVNYRLDNWRPMIFDRKDLEECGIELDDQFRWIMNKEMHISSDNIKDITNTLSEN